MLELNFQPFPELKTDRLLLRQLTNDDAEALFILRSDPAILKYLNKEPAASLKEVLDFINLINENVNKNESILWGIALAEQPTRLIGTVCFWHIRKEDYRGELGYVLHPQFWGKGLMKEALKTVIGYGFSQMQLNSIDAQLDPANKASAGVLETLGFTREAYFRENVCFGKVFGDTAVYGLLKRELKAS